jgi:hypothetical protein
MARHEYLSILHVIPITDHDQYRDHPCISKGIKRVEYAQLIRRYGRHADHFLITIRHDSLLFETVGTLQISFTIPLYVVTPADITPLQEPEDDTPSPLPHRQLVGNRFSCLGSTVYQIVKKTRVHDSVTIEHFGDYPARQIKELARLYQNRWDVSLNEDQSITVLIGGEIKVKFTLKCQTYEAADPLVITLPGFEPETAVAAAPEAIEPETAVVAKPKPQATKEAPYFPLAVQNWDRFFDFLDSRLASFEHRARGILT